MNDKICEWCEDTGIKTVAISPEDYEQEFCHCDVGVRLEEQMEAKDKPLIDLNPAKFEDVKEMMNRLNKIVYGV